MIDNNILKNNGKLENTPVAEQTGNHHLLPKSLAETFENPKNRQKNIGENVFDWATYGVIGGAVNFLLSMKFGYSGRYGKLSKHVNKWSEGLEKVGMSKDTAEKTLTTTALMMGGNVLIPVIRTGEHYREDIIDGINRRVGCTAQKTEDLPEQSWGSLIKGRLIAWAVVFGAFKAAVAGFGPEKFEQFEKDFAKNVVCKPLGKPTYIMGQETKLYRYGRIAALDVFATAASAVFLYFGSRFFAAQAQEKKEQETASQVEDIGKEKQLVIKDDTPQNEKDSFCKTSFAEAKRNRGHVSHVAHIEHNQNHAMRIGA